MNVFLLLIIAALIIAIMKVFNDIEEAKDQIDFLRFMCFKIITDPESIQVIVKEIEADANEQKRDAVRNG